MIFIGLLTDQQKQAGYFVSQDEDFIFLWHGKKSNPHPIGVFIYKDARVSQIREHCQAHLEGRLYEGISSIKLEE